MKSQYFNRIAKQIGSALQFSTKVMKVIIQSPTKIVEYQVKPIQDSIFWAEQKFISVITQLAMPDTKVSTSVTKFLSVLPSGMSSVQIASSNGDMAEYRFYSLDSGFWNSVLLGEATKSLAEPGTEILIKTVLIEVD